MVELIIEEVGKVLGERRFEHAFLRICETSGHLVVVGLPLKVKLREFVARLRVDCGNGLKLVGHGVEIDPLSVAADMLSAVDSGEKHVELGIHLGLRLIIAFHVVFPATLSESMVGYDFRL